MIIKDCGWSGHSKKYNIEYKGKQYTCYIEPFNCASNIVITGNGNNIDFKFIYGGVEDKDTKLGQEIYFKCLDLYYKEF